MNKKTILIQNNTPKHKYLMYIEIIYFETVSTFNIIFRHTEYISNNSGVNLKGPKCTDTHEHKRFNSYESC